MEEASLEEPQYALAPEALSASARCAPGASISKQTGPVAWIQTRNGSRLAGKGSYLKSSSWWLKFGCEFEATAAGGEVEREQGFVRGSMTVGSVTRETNGEQAAVLEVPKHLKVV